MSSSTVSGAADPLPSGGGEQTGPVSAAPTLALQLAEAFELSAMDHEPDGWPAFRQSTLSSAAAELRRLHAVNTELLDLMQRAIRRLEIEHAHGGSIMREWITEARAAIAKAGGQA
jgi:hypothetical protein